MRFLGPLSLTRDNNFDFIRFLLACGVIYTHAYNLSGRPSELVDKLTRQQFTLSGLAVGMFFVISGFLVSQSWDRSRGLADFTAKRLRRIMPGFVGAVLFCIAVVGPLSAPHWQDYLRDPTTWRFAECLLLKGPQPMLGVFQANPVPQNMDGSLWTIRFEMICYGLVALLGLAGGLKNRWASVVLLGACALCNYGLMSTRLMTAAPLVVRTLPPLALYFLVGAVAYVWRDRIPLLGWLAALCVAVLGCTRYGGMIYGVPFCGSYVLFYLAYSRRWRAYGFARNRDLSYGIYLYAFPVQQLFVQYRPGWPPLLSGLATLLVTTGLAFLSWHLVERPWLSRRRSVAPLQALSPAAPA